MSTRTDPWGRVALDPNAAFELAYDGFDIWSVPASPHPLIERFNDLCQHFGKDEVRIDPLSTPERTPEEEHALRSATWLISDDIKSIPVREFLLGLCCTDEQRARVDLEMDLFEARDLIPLLQLMMYLIDHFRRNGVVWGVGRGSSVASYCLYLIGVHKIDSIKYGLSIYEFLKD